MRYRTIVADPPWPIGDFPQWSTSERDGRVPCPYPTMSTEDIGALPVGKLAADNAHLYVWTINSHVEETYPIARKWGFEPSALLTWCKRPRPHGLGGVFPSSTEFILYCTKRTGGGDVLAVTTFLADAADRRGLTRGDIDRFMGTSSMGGWWLSRLSHRCACPRWGQWVRLRTLLGLDDSMDDAVRSINAKKGKPLAIARADSTWFTWPRGRHSAKPDAFLDLVEQVSPGPYLELFARRNRLGWDTWGNEALCHVSLEAKV